MERFDYQRQVWVTGPAAEAIARQQDREELQSLHDVRYWSGLLGWTWAQRNARIAQLRRSLAALSTEE